MKPIGREQKTETVRQYTEYQRLFQYWNKSLFGGKLPNVILTFDRKGKNSSGHYAPREFKRWFDEAGTAVAEININPDTLTSPWIEVCDTIVHEMIHHWQFEFGEQKPGKNKAHHNKEFAAKCHEIGLIPSDGKGKETGQKISTSPKDDPNTPFMVAFNSIPEDIKFPFLSDDTRTQNVKRPKPKSTRVKYENPSTGDKVWGKPGLELFDRNGNAFYEIADGHA